MSANKADSLYDRLGGYNAIAGVADKLLGRLRADAQLGRYWQHRGEDGIRREKQLLIDFLCHNAGGPMYYTGRTMALSHQGMAITQDDWQRFIGHLRDTLNEFNVPENETNDVLDFIGSTKADIVENQTE